MIGIKTFVLDKNRLIKSLDDLIVIEIDTSSKLANSSYGSYWGEKILIMIYHVNGIIVVLLL